MQTQAGKRHHPVHLKTWPQTLLTGSQPHQEACPRTPRNSSPAATPTSGPIWPPVLLDSAHVPPLPVWGLPREPTQTPTDSTWILTAGSTLRGWGKAHSLERFRALPWGKQMEALDPWTLQDGKKAHSLRSPPLLLSPPNKRKD